MKRKVLLVLIFFTVFYVGEITLSFSFKNADPGNFNSSEYIPISQSLDNFYSSNYQTIVIDNFLSEFLTKWDIKGASVAISKEGRLVYAKGFGYADIENGETVKPKHLFRIASVSKLITAVAIMKLQEEAKLSLNDTVFGINGILNDPEFSLILDSNVKQITVNQLLHHTAGWKKDKGDPIFSPLNVARKMKVEPPVGVDVTIQYMLQNYELDYYPGYYYSYSNFGYVILGKIIEKVSGMEYENYVKFAILHPLGIYDMKIGASFFEEKDSNEVKYYEPIYAGKCYAFDGSGRMVQRAYGGSNLEVLGAAGGWIASAAELMKLIVAIDGYPDKPDILSEESIQLMTTPNEFGNSLIGWRGTDGYGTWWRTGTLSGTSALVVRQVNNVNWVVMLNSSTKRKSRIHSEISRTMFKALGNMNKWPDYDLFHYQLFKDNGKNILAYLKNEEDASN